MLNKSAAMRLREFDAQRVSLRDADKQLTDEGYPGSEVLSALCVFGIQDSHSRSIKFNRANHFFENNPAKAQAIAEHLLKNFGNESNYAVICRAALEYMQSTSRHASKKHSLKSSGLFVLPYRATIAVLAITVIGVFFFELSTYLILATPLIFVSVYILLRWLRRRKKR